MPSVATLLTFTLAGIVLVAIPGPSVLFIVGRALAHGRRAALLSVAGNTTGASLVVVVVALGYGAVAARSIEVFTVLKLAGAAYLVYLGVQTFRHRGDLAAALDRPAGPAQRRLFWQGVVVGVTNPKVLIFFAAVLPQFVDLGAGGATGQMLVLGLLFALIAATLDSTWGLAAGAVRAWFATSPARLRLVGGTGGLTMVGLGIGLAFTGRLDRQTCHHGSGAQGRDQPLERGHRRRPLRPAVEHAEELPVALDAPVGEGGEPVGELGPPAPVEVGGHEPGQHLLGGGRAGLDARRERRPGLLDHRGGIGRELGEVARGARRRHLAHASAEGRLGDELGELDPGLHLLGGRVVRQLCGHRAHGLGDAGALGVRVDAVERRVDEVVDHLLALLGGESGEVVHQCGLSG